MYMERYTKNAKLIIYGVVKRKKNNDKYFRTKSKSKSNIQQKKVITERQLGTSRKTKKERKKDFGKVKQETKKK